MYLNPKTVISTFHSVPSDQPRSSVRPDLLPRVFCWDWKFCASGTHSVILAQRAAGPWQKWCCNRNISKLTYEQQRWLETHRNEAQKFSSQQNLDWFHSAPSQAIVLPCSHFLTKKGGQDSHLLGNSSQGATPGCYAPCPFRYGQKMEEIQPSGSSGTGHSLDTFFLIQQNSTCSFSTLLLHPLPRSTLEPQMGTL